MATCVGPPDVIVKGSFTVLIGNLPAARLTDMTAHGGIIVMGHFTTMIGEAGMGCPGTPVMPVLPGFPGALVNAAMSGAAFCEP
jgi:hypothetical protein